MTASRPALLRLAQTALLAAILVATIAAAPPGPPAAGSAARVAGQSGAGQNPSSLPSGRGQASGSRGDWWNDPEIRKELRLTEEQAQRIKDIFEKREQDVRPFWEMLNRENERLLRMTRERVAGEAEYGAQVAKVESLYARLRESRTVMVYRMYRELQPEQYKKLAEIQDRRRALDGRGGSAGPGR